VSRARRGLGGLAAALALAACEPGSVAPAPASQCREAGTQCALADGPLGVCERAACAPDAPPPCFACVPQH
jgi:hypothetical protein